MSKETQSYGVVSGMTVLIVSVSGGWTTIRYDDGKEGKVRNSQIKPASEAAIEAFVGQTKPSRAAKPAPAAKPANPAPAAPAVKPTPAPVVTPVNAEPEGDTVLSADGSTVLLSQGLVRPNYDKYVKHEVKSPSGRKALDIDDEVAALLRGQDIADCFFIAAKNIAKALGGDPNDLEAELHAKYDHLNVGMRRMNLGNRMRKAMGLYGNLNAHKGPSKPREAKPEKNHDDMSPAQQKAFMKRYGRRSGEVLKRADDQAE